MVVQLRAGTSYNYTVRVVRRSDMTDVVEPFEGSFTIVVLCKFLCVQNFNFVIASKGAPKSTIYQFPAIKH